GGVETGGAQRVRERGVLDRLAVGPFDRQLAEVTVAYREGERVDRRLQGVLVVGPGQQGAATTLDVQDELAVEQHHERARLAAGAVGADVTRTFGPGQRRTVRVRRVGGRQRDRGPGRPVVAGGRLQPQPVDRARRRELRGTEPF